jgi:hypothetical protein
MDPITIGVAVGTAVVSQLSGKLMQKAADPENVVKGVNWVFSAVDNFLKVQRGEKSKDAAIPPPPAATPEAEPPAEVDELEVEDKVDAVKALAKGLAQENEAPAPVNGGVRLLDLDDFTARRLANTIESVMRQLERHLDNLLLLEETAAEYGGLVLAPLNVRNDVRRAQEEITKNVRRLNKGMQDAYGAAAPDIDTLVRVARD